MSDHTTRLLEALKENHDCTIRWWGMDTCEVCQLIAEVEAELKGGVK
jgi:hypothetical protein